MNESASPTVTNGQFGLIKFISFFYLLLGLVFIFASLSGATIVGITLEPASAIVFSVLPIAAIGTLLRKNWGRLLSYFVSVIFLPGVPIGTLIGGYMIYHLSKHKALFKKNVPGQP